MTPAADPERPPAVLHLAVRSDWADAQSSGWYRISTRGATLAEVGFVHCSTAAQLPGVLARFYADVDPAALAVLVLDPGAIAAAGSSLRWEPVPGQPEPFPHVYGPIPTSAVRAVLPLPGPGAAPDLSAVDTAG